MIITYIVFFLKKVFRQHETDCSRREIFQRTPYASLYVKPLVGMVQQKRTAVTPVVKSHSERAAHGNNQFLTVTMGMPTTMFSRGHIVGPVHSADVERNVFALLHHSKIAARVGYFLKRYELS